jgi:LysM repeat protein
MTFNRFSNNNKASMKHFLAILTLVFLMSFTIKAQDKITKHTVAKGETISQIAQKYKITPLDIYRLNPDAQNGLKPEMVLLIQSNKEAKTVTTAAKSTAETIGIAKKETVAKSNEKVEKESKSSFKLHVVYPKETISSIAKTYNCSVEAIEKANPDIATNGLKMGSTIKIPEKSIVLTNEVKPITKTTVKAPVSTVDKTDKKSKEIQYHQVEAKETKYSIAKLYGISIQELETANPEIIGGLQMGFRLKIVGGNAKKEPTNPAEKTVEVAKEIVQPKKADFISYEVKPKETLYSLTKKFGMNQEKLMQLNPELKEGVKEGMTLKLPSNVIINEPIIKNASDFSKTISKQNRKQLVMLLPFNISKIESDSLNSITSRLKTDKFLNMTLDFYSGALMAIDSAKTLGLNVDVKIFDSQETKTTSNIDNVIQQNNVKNANVVIGPFYQANVEKTAELLSKSKVPVISPLSKENNKSFANLLQSMPSIETAKNAMFDYLSAKNGNYIAIIDSKKAASKQNFVQNHKEFKLVSLNEKNAVVSDSIVKKLLKNKMNYVVLDSEKTGTILGTINSLIALLPTYQIQLAILEKNNTLDFEEIALDKLVKLNMLYPSFTRDNETPEGITFDKNYKEKNKIFPNSYATRGFDITFDTLLRLAQEKSFLETIENDATEQVDSKFDYESKNAGTYTNKGVYILYYDTDLSVKIAK